MGDIEINYHIQVAYAKLAAMTNLHQNFKIYLRTRIMFLNSFVRSRLAYSCQNWNLTVGQLEKLDFTYGNLRRRMMRDRFKRIGDNNGDFQYKLNNEKVHAMCCISVVRDFFQKEQKDYAGHVVGMPNERCEKQLMFNECKYHRIGTVTPIHLEQVLKFNNPSIDSFINNSLKCWLENENSYI